MFFSFLRCLLSLFNCFSYNSSKASSKSGEFASRHQSSFVYLRIYAFISFIVVVLLVVKTAVKTWLKPVGAVYVLSVCTAHLF